MAPRFVPAVPLSAFAAPWVLLLADASGGAGPTLSIGKREWSAGAVHPVTRDDRVAAGDGAAAGVPTALAPTSIQLMSPVRVEHSTWPSSPSCPGPAAGSESGLSLARACGRIVGCATAVAPEGVVS